jgi:TonB family protein
MVVASAAGASDEAQNKQSCTHPVPVFAPDPKPPGSWVGKGPKTASTKLEVTVDKKGDVRDPVVIESSGDDVDKAAIDAVLRWKFKPARATRLSSRKRSG